MLVCLGVWGFWAVSFCFEAFYPLMIVNICQLALALGVQGRDNLSLDCPTRGMHMTKRKLKVLPKVSENRIRTIGIDVLKRAVSGIPLSQSHPALALELIDPGPFSAEEIVAGSNRVMLWLHARCGQKIKVSVAVRSRAWDEGSSFQGCYICAGREPQTRVAQVIPEWLQDQCLPDKNRAGAIKDISPLSQTYWQYRCPSGTGKIFSSRITDRVRASDGTEKQGCPCAKCYSGKRVNLLTAKKGGLGLAAMYIRTKENLGFEPSQLPYTHRVRWRCDKDRTHLFSRSLKELYETGCPLCQKQNEDNSLAAIPYRQIVREFLFVLRFPDLAPVDIKPGSNLVAFFRCACGETYKKAIYKRTQKNNPENCPYCAGKRSRAPRLFSQFPQYLRRWDAPKNVVIDRETGEEVEIEPDKVLADSRKKYWFICPAKHSYQASAVEIREGADQCPDCALLPNCVDNVRPEITKQWDKVKNGQRTPWNTAAGSSIRVWWSCQAGPDHQWEAKVYKRALEKNGCPFCSNRRLSVTNSVAALYPHLAILLHPRDNDGLNASQVIGVARQTLVWQCGCGCAYKRSVQHMLDRGAGCGGCELKKR